MYSRRAHFRRVQLSGDGYSAEPEDAKPSRPQAIALGYDPLKEAAPRVLASGRGRIAEQILAIARQNNIPVRNDPILAAALAEVEVDQIIPPELYAVVAEVLAYVYRLKHRRLP
jgi:flagellar biosynthesis protein